MVWTKWLKDGLCIWKGNDDRDVERFRLMKVEKGFIVGKFDGEM